MKNLTDQEDKLIRDLFKKSNTQPAVNMTELVIQRIDKSSEVFKYKPIISKNAWVLIGFGFSVLMILLIYQTSNMSLQTSAFIQLMEQGYTKFHFNFEMDLSHVQLPKIPNTLLIVIGAFNVIGVYLMISYKWTRRIFR